jgi:protease I
MSTLMKGKNTMPSIADARILIIATNGFEQSELEVPRDRLRAVGAKVEVASLDGRAIKGWDKKDWGRSVDVDLRIGDADPSDYDALVIPGGQINPDLLRVEDDVLKLVRRFLADGRVVAAICHGPWLLVEADALRGRKATSYPSIRRDVENAGAIWIDQEVVADRGIVTSRSPADLGAFVTKIVEEIREGRHHNRSDAA